MKRFDEITRLEDATAILQEVKEDADKIIKTIDSVKWRDQCESVVNMCTAFVNKYCYPYRLTDAVTKTGAVKSFFNGTYSNKKRIQEYVDAAGNTFQKMLDKLSDRIVDRPEESIGYGDRTSIRMNSWISETNKYSGCE